MTDLVNPSDLVSQAEAAELRGVSRASINELVKRGRLRSVEIGGKPFLYRSEVLSFEPDKGGRPPNQKPASAASQMHGTIASRTKTTRKLNNAVRRTAEEQMASKKKVSRKAIERWEGEGGAVLPKKGRGK